MNKTVSQRLFDANEPYAAGLFEFPDREPIYRYSNASYRFWEHADLEPYEGGMLYPCGKTMGKAGVHQRQPLVLVNTGGASGADIKALSDRIMDDVMQKFGIKISPEVNFI